MPRPTTLALLIGMTLSLGCWALQRPAAQEGGATKGMETADRPQGLPADALKAEFDRRYQAWRGHLDTNPRSRLSSDPYGGGTGWKLYLRIVELGTPALPYIIDKIEGGDWRLGSAVSMITQKRFASTEYIDPRFYGDTITKARMYVDWWRHGRKDTPQKFDALYAEWRSLKGQGREAEAQERYRAMLHLGIEALPLMLARVEKGETGFAPAISRLTDGAVKPDATAQDVTAWWAKDKAKWTLPEERPAQPAAQPPTSAEPSAAASGEKPTDAAAK